MVDYNVGLALVGGVVELLFAVIVNAGGGDIGVAEPLLDLGDVGLMFERIGGGRRAQRMGAALTDNRPLPVRLPAFLRCRSPTKPGWAGRRA